MTQSILFIANDPPYGTERAYNAFRLAGSAAKREGTSTRVFLMGDSVGCAIAGQKLPDGYYKLDRMLTSVVRHGGEVGCCGTCMDARGIPRPCSSRAPGAPPSRSSPTGRSKPTR